MDEAGLDTGQSFAGENFARKKLAGMKEKLDLSNLKGASVARRSGAGGL